MVLDWCNYHDEGSGEPSLCQLFIALGAVNLFFIVILCGRALFLANIIAMDLIGERLRILSFMFLSACTLEAVLTLSLLFVIDTTQALIFAQVTQALGWIICGGLVIIETWRIRNWPWIVVKVYVFAIVVMHAVVSTTLQTEEFSTTTIALSLSHLAIAFVLLLLVLCKDCFKTSEDFSNEEIRRVSGEFIKYDPIRRKPDGGLLSWIFGGMSNQDSGRRHLLDDNHHLLHDDGNDEFTIDFSANSDGIVRKSAPSGFNWNTAKPLVVESAIERNIQGGMSPNSKTTKANKPSLLKSMFFKQTASHSEMDTQDAGDQQGATTPLIAAEEPQDNQSTSSANSPLFSGSVDERSNSSISFRSQDSFSASGTSRALMQVMDQHRAKLSASNPVLEPRGSDDASLFARPTTSTKSKMDDVSSSSEKKESNKLESFIYQVTVQRWGIRNRKLSEHEAQEYRRLNMIEEDSSAELPLISETEFEIIINIRNQDSQDIVEQAWNNTQKAKISKWTVWRTAAELNKLHSQMLNYLGDLTPRRPRLHAVTTYDAKANANFSYAELMADMRSIAIYLNALMRTKNGTALKPLRDFLELERGVQQTTPTPPPSTAVSIIAPNAIAPINNESITELSDANSSKVQSLEDWERDVMKKPGSEPSSPSHHHNNSSASNKQVSVKGAVIQTALNAGQSLMDAAAEISASNQSVNNQEKWRKLFFRMKIKLKPRDIGIRCRLFEGVLSGSEVSAWLIHSDSSNDSSEAGHYRHARDRFEACAIGQELLGCGLLLPVCAGFIDEDGNHGDIDPPEIDSPSGKPPSGSTALTSLFEEKAVFSDMPGYIYRFPLKSGTAGSWSLFGASVAIKIPIMTFSDENDSKYTRDTIGFSILDNSMMEGGSTTLLNINSEEQQQGSSGATSNNAVHVKYLIDITHGTDSWQTTRRYREFEQFQKQLAKEGVKAEVPLPPKTIMNVISRVASSGRQKQMDDTRRMGLEQYLISAVQAVIDSGSDRALLILAQFLDDEYHNLRIINP